MGYYHSKFVLSLRTANRHPFIPKAHATAWNMGSCNLRNKKGSEGQRRFLEPSASNYTVASIGWLFLAISGPKQRWTKWSFQVVTRMQCIGEDTFVTCRTSSQMTRASPFTTRVSKTVHDSLVNGREEVKEVNWNEIKDLWPSNPRPTKNTS